MAAHSAICNGISCRDVEAAIAISQDYDPVSFLLLVSSAAFSVYICVSMVPIPTAAWGVPWLFLAIVVQSSSIVSASLEVHGTDRL